MTRRFSILVGITLILIGGLSMAFNLAAPVLDIWGWESWRLWPLVVVGAGLLFVLAPLVARGHRGLGGLFIPGVPILATGGILLYASVFDMWDAWEWLWPMEVLALALGFLLAAIYMWTVWLIIPATIIGANGALLQFCAITDFWEVWAVLWTIEPLAVGLSLLVVSARKRSVGLFLAGLILCGLAGAGLIAMTPLFYPFFWPGIWLINMVGPALLILVGLLLLIWGAVRRSPAPAPSVE